MQLTMSEDARLELEKQLVLHPRKALKLEYDTEGCGCAVNGIAQLRWVDDPGADAVAIAEHPIPAYAERRQTVFFEERLHLDYQPERRTYRLSSPSQTYISGLVIKP